MFRLAAVGNDGPVHIGTEQQAEKFAVGAFIKTLKGTADYMVNTFEAGRAKERTRTMTLFVQAVDKAGNVSEPASLPVDVLYYSSTSEDN